MADTNSDLFKSKSYKSLKQDSVSESEEDFE